LETIWKPEGAEFDKAIFITSSTGPAIEDTSVPSLHTIGKRYIFAKTAYQIYEETAGRKIFREYDTSEHAQELLNTDFKNDIAKAILTFRDAK